MPSSTVEQQLIELEKEYWRAIRDRDTNAAMRLTDDTCVVAGAQGVASIDHQGFAKMMQSPAWSLHEFELSDVQAHLVTEDVGVVAYKVKEHLTVEGKPLTLDAADASTWVKRDGKWVCALHTEAISGDPFGRDRDGSARK